MEYLKSEASESVGPAVYDLGEKAALKTKMEKIIKTFEDMTSKVVVAVKAGKRKTPTFIRREVLRRCEMVIYDAV